MRNNLMAMGMSGSFLYFEGRQRNALKNYVRNNNIPCAYGGELYSRQNPISYEHIEPSSSGVTDNTVGNKLVICQPCNSRRSSVPLKDFVRQKGVKENLLCYLVRMKSVVVNKIAYLEAILPALANQLSIPLQQLQQAIQTEDPELLIVPT